MLEVLETVVTGGSGREQANGVAAGVAIAPGNDPCVVVFDQQALPLNRAGREVLPFLFHPLTRLADKDNIVYPIGGGKINGKRAVVYPPVETAKNQGAGLR